MALRHLMVALALSGNLLPSQAQEPLPGVGSAIKGIGRFGFSKGDGLLDLTYNQFGLVEKTHLAGHPRNLTRQPWAISFRPPLAVNPKELPPSEWPQRIKDDCEANWLSARWTSDLTSTGDVLGRATGDRFRYTVTYGVASPGILVETDDRVFRLAFQRAASYRALCLPLQAGFRSVPIPSDAEAVYDVVRDGPLTDNFLLLTGADAFPTVPLLLVIQSNPTRILQERQGGRTTALTLEYPQAAGFVVLCTPSGAQAFDPADAAAKPDPASLRERARTLLAPIVDGGETFSLDAAAGLVTVTQRFTHRILQDAWHTAPLRAAPYPPALSLAQMSCDQVRLLDAPSPTGDFATRYGTMRSVAGQDTSSYQLPIPPRYPHIPIPPRGSALGARVAAAYPIPRPAPDQPLPGELHPGLWSRPDRNAADVAALLGNWFVMWPYLSAEAAANLKRNAADLLPDLLDDQERFATTDLFRSVQQTPADAGKLTRPMWFTRQEPFSAKTYLVSYTQPNVRKTGQPIPRSEGTFTDLEWGNGLALEGVRQAAQLSGAWDTVERNWAVVQGIYGLFELLQDWPTLSVSGCESGMRWTDTTSYRAYPAFSALASRLGNEQAYREGVYLHAKHAAMRMAMFNAGLYLGRLYDSSPWMVCHDFVEMDSGYQEPFEPHRDGRNIYPSDWLRGTDPVVQRNSFYSLAAEGVCYECPDLFYTLMPEATHRFLTEYLRLFPEWCTAAGCEEMNARHFGSGGITLYQCILFMLRDPYFTTSELHEKLDGILRSGMIARYLQGYYGRYVGCQEYAEALLETRDDPAWLADWRGVELSGLEYDRATRTVHARVAATGTGELLLGGREPSVVRLNGAPLLRSSDAAPGTWSYAQNLVRVQVAGAGALELEYQ